MPPRKKPAKNGFFQFMMEFKSRHNRTFRNNEELAAEAGKRWSIMSKEEKEPYSGLARMERNNFSKENLTSDGRPLSQVAREEEERHRKVDDMKNDIVRIVTAAQHAGELQNEMFFLIHINNLVYHPSSDRHYLCEIAVAGFTLKYGVQERYVYHKLINPGDLPMGYYGDAKAHSDLTHQLFDVVYQDKNGVIPDNTEEVFCDLIRFLQQTTGNSELPPLYSMNKRMDMCNTVMRTWCDDFEYQQPIKIYELEHLFFALRNAAAGHPVLASDTFCYTQLEKDIYCHNNEAACLYHTDNEQPIYCSRSIVVRYIYIICDNCCADLDIKLILGCHVPKTASVPLGRLNPQQQSGGGAGTSTGNHYYKSFPSLEGGGQRGGSSKVSEQMESGTEHDDEDNDDDDHDDVDDVSSIKTTVSAHLRNMKVSERNSYAGSLDSGNSNRFVNHPSAMSIDDDFPRLDAKVQRKYRK